MGITTSFWMDKPDWAMSRSSVNVTDPSRLFSMGTTPARTSLLETAAPTALIEE